MKRILLFPGQGSQHIGMGMGCLSNIQAARRLEQASDLLNIDMKQLMEKGPEEELRKTENTQPAIFLASMMAMDCLREKNPSFDLAAGHSLGEYSALCAAGAISFEDGIRLVRRRGELMAGAGDKRPGAMAAIIGMEREPLEKVLLEARTAGTVVVANFNSLSQTVISGEKGAVQKACDLASSAGAKKVVMLPVSGAFHSPLMDFAVSGLSSALDQVTFSAPAVPVITNVTGEPCKDSGAFKNLLLLQLTSSVQWVASIQKAIGMGISEGVEVGPGKVLMGLVRGISRDLKVQCVATAEEAATAA